MWVWMSEELTGSTGVKGGRWGGLGECNRSNLNCEKWWNWSSRGVDMNEIEWKMKMMKNMEVVEEEREWGFSGRELDWIWGGRKSVAKL